MMHTNEDGARLDFKHTPAESVHLITSFAENVKRTHNQKPCCNFPTRYVIGIMAMMSSTFAYIIRASFSLNLLAMVNVYDENGTMIPQPDHGERYDWGAYEQGLLLGGFYYAYTVSTLFCGLIVDRYGIGRQFVFAAFVLSAIAVLLGPLAATAGTFGWLFALRLVIGLMQGGTFPNIHRLISKWAPPHELGKFTVSILGSNVGTVLSWIIAGAVIEAYGWPWSFYSVGLLVTVFLALWWYNVYDRPSLHPRIRPEERAFIEQSKPLSTSANEWPPFLKLFTSPPFLALIILQFSVDWGVFFLMTGVPKFMNQVLGFRISSTGLLSTLPYITRTLAGVLFSSVGDHMHSRKCMPVVWLRKLFVVFSHILPSIFLLCIPFVAADQPYICVAMMTLAFGLNGAITQTTLVNYHDLGPTCAASLMSIANSVGATSGFLSPLVVAYFTSERNTIVEWRYIFITGGSVYLLAALIFIVFGRATEQKWTKQSSENNEVAPEVR